MLTNDIIKKLEYIKLDLNNIPNFLKEQEKPKYRPKKISNEKNYKVYKYIDVKDIEILITTKNRLTDILERFEESASIYDYLNKKNKEKFAIFQNLLKQITIEDIEELQNIQNELNRNIPLTIKYPKDYLWQIYYSEEENKYFMLAPISESEYAEIFYLLKKRLENSNEKIFVPICYSDYSYKILKNQEINNLENSLYLFTNNWPFIYEVYDKDNNYKLVITGKTKILENIQSDYRIDFNEREEALEFYNLVQALFLLQTHYPKYYNFNIKVLPNGEIEFSANNEILKPDKIVEYIKQEYKKHLEEIVISKEKKMNLENELKVLNKIAEKKQQIFLEKEKQISTYLECKKTFLGKVKYFFKYKKVKSNIDDSEINEENKKTNQIKYCEKPQIKKIYTIQELLEITKQLEEESTNIKNLQLDIEGVNRKIELLNKKNENANLYIQEIDKHKKSIFDFWKFTSKDEINQLPQGLENKPNTKIKKSFNFSSDLYDLENDLDKKARKNLTKHEQDMAYLTTTSILQDINLLLNNEEIPNEHLVELKHEYESIKTELTLNIFNELEEKKLSKSKSHRETAKNKFAILDIDDTTTLQEYKTILTNIINEIDEIKEKITPDIDVPVYFISRENMPNKLALFSIDPMEMVKGIKEGEVNIYSVLIDEQTNFIPLTNIIYFNNLNDTLPIGMEQGTKVLLDMSKLELKLIEEQSNNVLTFEDEKLKALKINIYKYKL